MKFIKIFILCLGMLIICPGYTKAESILEDWSQTSQIATESGGIVALTYNNNIYALGGSASYVVHNRLYSQPNIIGNLSTWKNLTSTSKITFWHSGVKKGDHFYILGGHNWPDGGSDDSVYKGKFEELGDVYDWTLEPNLLPERLSNGNSVIIGDWIYYAGGFTDSPLVISKNVHKAKIYPDGSIGKWDETAVAGYLPLGLSHYGIATNKNRIIFIGGWDTNEGASNHVWSATMDPVSGDVLGWETLASLPVKMRTPAIAQTEKGVIVMGGYNDLDKNLDGVYYSPFDANGNTTGWETSGHPLPWKINTGAGAILGEYVYIIGGYAVKPGVIDGATKAVWKAKLSPEVLAPPKDPLILIPGMGASFNDVLIHGGSAPNEDWNIASFVKNYDSLIKSYEGRKLYIYNYDWRKPISDNALDLKDFVDKKGFGKVEIVGHSMGGLIGARFGSRFPEKLVSLKTLGSPFGGSAKAYKIWEGADLTGFSGFEKIAISLLLKINASGFDSDVQTIQKIIPSFQNILPVYNFLKKENGNMVPLNSLVWKNNFWPYLQKDLGVIADKTTTVFGSEVPTEKIFTIKNRTILDQVLGKWVDGKPVDTEKESGDGTVLEESAVFGDKNTEERVGVEHGDLPDSEAHPKFDTALVMAIASPVTFEVSSPSGTMFYPENEVLVINNPEVGTYSIKIKPVSLGGKFSFYFGRISKYDSAWDDFSGDTNIDEENLEYTVNWGNRNLGTDPIARALARLEKIKTAMGNASINAGEKQVFAVDIRNLGADILMFPAWDENRKASILRTAIQKTNQAKVAWNQPDPEFTKLVVYNLRLLTRDVQEAMGNL